MLAAGAGQGLMEVVVRSDSSIAGKTALSLGLLWRHGENLRLVIYIPYGHSTVDGDLTTQVGTISFNEGQSGLGDVAIIPASIFFWNSGNFHFNLYELNIAPTGVYNVGENVFVGRNYWSFDTVLAATWFDPEKGTELSAVGNIMLNTENNPTDYRTGTEFHLDLIAKQFLSEEFAVGLRGCVYHQLTGDSGSGVLLGEFKGESIGGGFGLFWIPKAAGGKFSVTASWVRDLYVKRRLEADYATVALALTFWFLTNIRAAQWAIRLSSHRFIHLHLGG